jgi:hypothetical protein
MYCFIIQVEVVDVTFVVNISKMVDINAKISAIMINVFNVTRNSAQEKT